MTQFRIKKDDIKKLDHNLKYFDINRTTYFKMIVTLSKDKKFVDQVIHS